MASASPDALERARRVKLMIFDVDGVLTDGNLWYSPTGEEIKAFHAFDGHGVKMLGESGVRLAGLDTAILSGRESQAVEERAKELGIRHVVQGAGDKLAIEASGLMEAHKIHALLVVDAENRVVGALNIHDLLRARVV